MTGWASGSATAITRTAILGRSSGTQEVREWSSKKDALANSPTGVFRPLIRGGLGLGRVDFDAALEVGTVFDADARGGNITNDRAIRFDVDAVTGVQIADDLAVDDYFAGVNFGIELSGRTHR